MCMSHPRANPNPNPKQASLHTLERRATLLERLGAPAKQAGAYMRAWSMSMTMLLAIMCMHMHMWTCGVTYLPDHMIIYAKQAGAIWLGLGRTVHAACGMCACAWHVMPVPSPARGHIPARSYDHICIYHVRVHVHMHMNIYVGPDVYRRTRCLPRGSVATRRATSGPHLLSSK